MNLHLPLRLHQRLPGLPPGTAVYGTFDPVGDTATATTCITPGAPPDAPPAPHTRHLLAVTGTPAGDPYTGHTGHTGDTADTATLITPITRASLPPLRYTPATGWCTADGRPVAVTVYNPAGFFNRTPFDPTVCAHLAHERVLIVGLGSVGAPMGVQLAQAGVGEIIALDKDSLGVHNCMRHVLGTAYIGWSKAHAFAHHLAEHAPACTCLPVHGDRFEPPRMRLRELIHKTRPTRILAVTDSLRIQYLCQRLALHAGIPYMAVWCDDHAVEGEVFMWAPGEAASWHPGRPRRGCYACMRNPDEPTLTRSSAFDYASDDPDTYGGEPALGCFIERICSVASIHMLAWMLRGCQTPTRLATILDEPWDGLGLQYLRLGGAYPHPSPGRITARQPWGVEWYRVLPRRGCTFCGDASENTRILFRDTEDANV